MEQRRSGTVISNTQALIDDQCGASLDHRCRPVEGKALVGGARPKRNRPQWSMKSTPRLLARVAPSFQISFVIRSSSDRFPRAFILRWIENQDYRRRIHRQLNKGEALHALRRFLFFAHEGKVQRRQADQQTNQILCLNLVTNAIVTWNTVYMNAAIERLRAEGRIGRDIDLGHLSPALYGHVNPYGKYRFEIEARAPGLRPLRSPGNDA